MEKKSDTSSLVSPGTRDEQTESSVSPGALSEGSSSRQSHTADQAENLIGLASEAILRFKMATEAESKSRMETGAPVTKDVAVSLGNIFKFVISASHEIAQTFVSVVVEMKDFMQLLFSLIQQCILSK